MEKFIAQFKMTPMQALMFEQFIFRMADKVIDGYNGGMWGEQTLGKTLILTIPANGDRVGIHNVFGGETVTTDPLTASAAFTSLVNNWFWNEYAEKLSNTSNKAFEKAHHGLRRDAFSTGNGVNHNDMFTITD